MKRAASLFAAACILAAGAFATSAPEYPLEARQAGIEGSVKLEVTADAQGNVTDAKILEATPPGTFDAAALKAAKARRYPPTGREARYTVVMEFKKTPE
jgi:protein TonB